MFLFIDADACPVVRQAEQIAKAHGISVVILCDTNHILHSDYSEVITVSAGADAVDFELVNRCKKGDIVITQDYGLAAMALSRGCYPIHQSGMLYTEQNIDLLLAQRYESKKARMQHAKHHLKGPKKRTEADDKAFCAALEKLILKIKQGTVI